MPSRNIVREYVPERYYHVYNRGIEKRLIFLDDQDYITFLGLLKKYLIGESLNKNNRHQFKVLGSEVRLLAYCLMPNHFHLLLWQKDADGITQLMRRVSTGYVMYFNQKYARVGGLFQGKYKASNINTDGYLHHISRYIHLNPAEYKTWPYSSLPYYQGIKKAEWVNTDRIMELFENNVSVYTTFLQDYEEAKEEMAALKWQLANGADM